MYGIRDVRVGGRFTLSRVASLRHHAPLPPTLYSALLPCRSCCSVVATAAHQWSLVSRE